ncbi:MAG TPA: aconitate hydratase [Kofleriaceae bacterium]|nr:aconitate hydratase [Kofleriaceae bacterium]
MAPPTNLASKLLASHLVEGTLTPGEEIAIRVDQTLTQDATGTLVMLELEAMGLDRVRTELSVQYVDHNLLQEDFKNADDHLFLRSACRRLGIWYSPPGNGVSHPLHMERFGKPGKTLIGSDSHTCAAGALGMLAIGTGGLEVALAMTGEPFHVRMPAIWGVRLDGALPDWVSAKDVILEMLRRHGVAGGLGRIIEYYGPGLAGLSAMDRHVIANMGAELGATATVFPGDDAVRRFLRAQDREADFVALAADDGAGYDAHDAIDLSQLEPLIALPSSPGNVVPVREVAGREIYQAYIGSSANPGYRDFAIAAAIVDGRHVHDRVSFDINPTSRQMLENLIAGGHVATLLRAGARLHQAGCNGCIGMGQAPATDRISLRTVPRNFPGRSGTREDQVYLVSPETAAASALAGAITDPRTLGMAYPTVREPEHPQLDLAMFVAPLPAERARAVALERGPNIRPLPGLEPVPSSFDAPVLLKLGHDISTDEILPAGARVLPFRSNVEQLAAFAFEGIDREYAARARQASATGHVVVAGRNYGQGSSREHAALVPRSLGLRVVLAIQFARIHRANLVNFGVLPLTFVDPADYDRIAQGDVLAFADVHRAIGQAEPIAIEDRTRGITIRATHGLSPRQVELVLAGGLIPVMRRRLHHAA